MSEHEGGESKSVGAFLLGFLTGVLVCLGVGGSFFVVRGRHAMEEARMMEMVAREAEARARMEAERAAVEAAKAKVESERAEKALREAKAAKEKKDKEGP